MNRPFAVAASTLGAAALISAAVVAAGQPASAARTTAICTNATTDAAKIQTAINGSAVGDEVVIDGPCLINTPITLLGKRTYRGDSRATVLTEASGSNLAGVLVSDSWARNWSTTGESIVIRDLTIDAAKGSNPSGGDGMIIRSWQTTIENVTVKGAKANGIRITNRSKNGTVLTNSQVNGTVRNVFVTDSGENGIYVEDSGNSVTDWNLTDNWIASSGQNAIRTQNAAGWTIERNHVYGDGAAGISADRLFATSISDNYIEDFVTNGIKVTVQGDAASVIANNRIFQFKGSGTTFLNVSQVNYGTGRISVIGNTVRGKGTGTGLNYQRGSNQLTVTSTGNQVTGVTTPRVAGSGVTLDTGI